MVLTKKSTCWCFCFNYEQEICGTCLHWSHSWLSSHAHRAQYQQSESAQSRIHTSTLPIQWRKGLATKKKKNFHALDDQQMMNTDLFKFIFYSFGDFILLLKGIIQVHLWNTCPDDWTWAKFYKYWMGEVRMKRNRTNNIQVTPTVLLLLLLHELYNATRKKRILNKSMYVE